MFDKIVEILKEELSLDVSKEITEDTVLREDLDADSLNIIEVIMVLEDEFGIEISEDEFDALDGVETVGDLEKYISAKVNQ